MLLKTVISVSTAFSCLLIANADEASNISGTHKVPTLTLLERPLAFGNNLYFSREEANWITNKAAASDARADAGSDPEREAPKEGGNIDGYNIFWIDRGNIVICVYRYFITSMISRLSNGRILKMTKNGQARSDGFLNEFSIIWLSPAPTLGNKIGAA